MRRPTPTRCNEVHAVEAPALGTTTTTTTTTTSSSSSTFPRASARVRSGGTSTSTSSRSPGAMPVPVPIPVDKDKEGRLSRVKRILADSLLPGRRATAPGARSGARSDPGTACGTPVGVVSAPSPSPATPSSRHFGVPLGETTLTKEGVPLAVVKICTYLENHGLQHEGLFERQEPDSDPRLQSQLQSLRASLDLHGADDVVASALLLKLWLLELPEPVVHGRVAAELLVLHEKVREEPTATWRQSIRTVLCSLPELNLRLLRYILRFLHRYNQHQQQQRSSSKVSPTMLNRLGSVFAPLLVLKGMERERCETSVVATANHFTSRLILDHAAIFHQWLLDHPSGDVARPVLTATGNKYNHTGSAQIIIPPDGASGGNPHLKRKERNESANSNQSLERKVVRSNSAERHMEEPILNSKCDSIRRVSSHEDFSHVKHQAKLSSYSSRCTTVVELSGQPQTMHFNCLPLQECNHKENSQNSQSKDYHQILHTSQDINGKEKENEHQVLLSHQGDRDPRLVEITDDEHEKRRSCERVSRSLVPPRSAARRNIARRKRSSNAPSVEQGGEKKNSQPFSAPNEETENTSNASHFALIPASVQSQIELSEQCMSPEDKDDDDCEPEAEVESLSDESLPESNHSFLQLHPPERERSPSPSVSPCTPPLDLSTLHQSVDSNEPVASRPGWSFARQHRQEDEGGRGILLSPRNSMILTRRVYMDHNVPPSPPGDHCLPGQAIDLDNLVKKLNKQITSLKKRLKRYEEGFEREFGYRPSQADKMANKDIKKMCMEMSRLRKELKEIKENPLSALVGQFEPSAARLGLSGPCNGSSLGAVTCSVSTSITDTVDDMERRLREKRRSAGRPEVVDDMTPEQQAAEKIALQKALLMLEKVCGRATSKQDREIVRPLYDRYRLLKRTVARAASSKLKDSITELATIHEHEAMEFTPSSQLAVSDGPSNNETTNGVTSSCSPEVLVVTSSNGTIAPIAQLQPALCLEETSDSQTSSSDSLGENLHSLPLSDLVLQLTQTREEKKRIRRLLREQEEKFQQRTGRRMLREERLTVNASGMGGESTGAYSAYKQVKAKLRLLEALVAKQR